ncbi:DUF397 domain-containing protein [Saccharopolyspora sp. HNM0983]|uniref:DUF397 domain-containing protein n=1 Tax=Saccharopolyspora montiporae TaxID=2781240 RepID=A0A929G0Z1_9PSEU|nr:DUF397 domain-containing protein [Saccharopolyspora sp. HNM0983]MBE9376115.1 DUF397 domain-containing protein [Saccharopolyspora sp. HNM0983]
MPSTPAFGQWRKSSRSNGQGGQCVEVGFTADGALAGIRDTKEAGDPDRGTLAVSRSSFRSFLDAVRRGDVAR